MMIAALVFLFSFSISAPVFTAQTPQVRIKHRHPSVKKSLRLGTAPSCSFPRRFLIINAFDIRLGSHHVEGGKFSCHVGDTLSFHAEVTNKGPQPLKKVKIAFYLNHQLVGSAVHDLKAHETKAFDDYDVKPKKAATYTAKAVADPDGTFGKRVYRGNTASISITVFARMSRKIRNTARTDHKSAITLAGMKKRAPFPHSHGNTYPGLSHPTSIKKPKGQTVPLISGKILKVTVKVQGPFRPLPGLPRGQKSYGLNIRWACEGVVPNRVDILLYPRRQFQKKISLIRGGSNCGHYTKTLTGINEKQKYVVRVQSRDGRMYKDSKAFYFKYATVAGAHKKIPRESSANEKESTLGSGKMRLSQPSITGHVIGGSEGFHIQGRKVKILLKQGRQTIFSQIKTLDSNGACDYRFLPMVLGTYFVTVEKVASTAGTLSSTLNVCFDGTTPVSRTITLTKRSQTISAQDFTINFYIAWDYPHLCW